MMLHMRYTVAIMAVLVFSGSAAAGDATAATVLKHGLVEYHVERDPEILKHRSVLAELEQQLFVPQHPSRAMILQESRQATLDSIQELQGLLRSMFQQQLFGRPKRRLNFWK
jgi:hypothetical protein